MDGWAFIASLEGREIVDHHIIIIARAVLACSGRCWEYLGGRRGASRARSCAIPTASPSSEEPRAVGLLRPRGGHLSRVSGVFEVGKFKGYGVQGFQVYLAHEKQPPPLGPT